jgi:hypothetical protein
MCEEICVEHEVKCQMDTPRPHYHQHQTKEGVCRSNIKSSQRHMMLERCVQVHENIQKQFLVMFLTDVQIAMNSNLAAQLEQLEKIGFVLASAELSQFLSENPEIKTKFARFSLGLGSSSGSQLRYTTNDIFGAKSISYYYNLERKNPFERHLEKLFRKRNPYSSAALRGVFERKLHDISLHSSQCRHQTRPVGSKGVPRGKATAASYYST